MGEASQSGEHKASPQESEPQKCFIAHSHQAEWHDTIEAVCNELLPAYGLQPWYAEYNFDPRPTLRDKIVSMIDNAPYGIYDLSYWRANDHSSWVMPYNVLIELGIAIALNRPTILLRHTENRLAKIELPTSLQSITQICEFTGGDYSLEKALRPHLSNQTNFFTDYHWHHHRCYVGEIDCTYIQVYPHSAMMGHNKLHCHIADGPDTDQLDFRRTVEKVLGHFNNISYSYLDKVNVPGGYTFLLCAHCQLIRSTPFAIYRITPDTSPDTYIAIGMSIGLEYRFHYKIPRFLITKNIQYVPSLLQGYEFVLMKNFHTLKTRLPQFVQHILTKIDEPAYWRPQELPFETHIPLDSEIANEDRSEETSQLEEEERKPVAELLPTDLKAVLDHMDDSTFLENSTFAHTYYVALNKKTNPQARTGILVRDLLKVGFERMRGGGTRSDSAPEWRSYNILYYHYFKYHLPNAQTASRLYISMRQFYREQDRAIQTLLKEILGLEKDLIEKYGINAINAKKTLQQGKRENISFAEISLKDLKDVLDNIEDNDFLEGSKFAETHYVTLNKKANPQTKTGILVRDLLKAGFERLQGDGTRSDFIPAWRHYNILWYYYFKYHLSYRHIAQRMEIGMRQLYRERDRALEKLLIEILELERNSFL